MASPTTDATIIALSLESLLYGLFLSLFVASTCFLPRTQQRASRRPYSTLTFYLSAAMFILVTLHWAVSLAMTLQALVFFRGGSFPDVVSAGSSASWVTVKGCILAVLLMVGNINITYRLWVVWDHHKCIVIPPIILSVGYMVSIVVLLSVVTVAHPGQLAQDQALGKLLAAPYATAMCTSFYCTALISWKVWKVERAVKGSTDSGGRWLVWFRAATVESAVLYSCWFTFFLAACMAPSPVILVASDTMAQITGIAFIAIDVLTGNETCTRLSPGVWIGCALVVGFVFEFLAVSINQSDMLGKSDRDGDVLGEWAIP